MKANRCLLCNRVLETNGVAVYAAFDGKPSRVADGNMTGSGLLGICPDCVVASIQTIAQLFRETVKAFLDSLTKADSTTSRLYRRLFPAEGHP